MSIYNARPAFGSRRCIPAYYEAIGSVLTVLRPIATLQTIAHHLNNAGFSTPTGKPWTKQRVATYLRGAEIPAAPAVAAN
jgi:hypothetical protein